MKIIRINDLDIEVEKKRIKNMYLKVYPPDGRIHISAPYGMSNDRINAFVLARMDWILEARERVRSKYKDFVKAEMQYLDGEAVYFDGCKYNLLLAEGKKTGISISGSNMIMHVRQGSTMQQRRKILYDWYRKALQDRIGVLLEKWEPVIGVKASGFGIRSMKTRWGSCNIKSARLTFSLQLAQKNLSCVEYVVVHELVHLLEASHNHIFKAYMDKFLPDWRRIKKELNSPQQAI